MSDDYLWDPKAEPDAEIERLERTLRPASHVPQPMRTDILAARPTVARRTRWSAIAAALLVIAGGTSVVRRTGASPWSVDTLQGVVQVRTSDGQGSHARLEPGGVLETDATSRARLAVGAIGRADLGPGSRLRLIESGARRQLLSLERGTMHASVNAPPRYFLVQTASALAADLGCEYVLTVDESGNGRLTVEEGEVELQWSGSTVSVLAGNTAVLRGDGGPGLPYPVRGSEALRRAVAAYDASPTNQAALDAVLAASDSGSTITLWHLLYRVTPVQRERVFAKLAAIAPPPATVSRERILLGESGAMQRWRTDLQRTWAVEPPMWRRVWRRVTR